MQTTPLKGQPTGRKPYQRAWHPYALLLPGVEGFVSDDGIVVNPSYWIFHSFEELQRLDYSVDVKFRALLVVVEHARKHGQKVVVYSERLETVLYVEEGLARYHVDRVASVVEAGESGAQLKSSTAIEQLIRHFAPISSTERGKRPPEDKYDVLLATDALSEGINLQDASFLVSYDLAWTADTIIQRAGRILRLWSEPRTVELYTFVPLPGRRSSLVWVVDPRQADELQKLDDAALAREIERRAHSMLGRMEIESARGVFPLAVETAERFASRRVALVGDAAHLLPPIGAQGLNLGIRDAITIAELTVDVMRSGGDPGSEIAMEAYGRRRRADVRSRTLFVELFNRSLLSGFLPAHLARGLGLELATHVGFVRRALMRQGLGPSDGEAPRLMRGEPI